AAGLQNLAFADGEFFPARSVTRNGSLELCGSSRRVEFFGGDGAGGQGRPEGVGKFGGAARGRPGLRGAARAGPGLAVTQAANQWSAAGGDAGFAVEERDGDEICLRVECGRLGGDDDALEGAA